MKNKNTTKETTGRSAHRKRLVSAVTTDYVIAERFATKAPSEGWVVKRGKKTTRIVTTPTSVAVLDKATKKYAKALSRLAEK